MSSLPVDLVVGKLDLRKAIDNFIEAPLEEIIKKLEESGVVKKVGVRWLEIICVADQRVLERAAQEDVGRGPRLDQEDCRYRSQDQKGLATRMD